MVYSFESFVPLGNVFLSCSEPGHFLKGSYFFPPQGRSAPLLASSPALLAPLALPRRAAPSLPSVGWVCSAGGPSSGYH